MIQDDWKDVKRIYKEGIKTKNATFEQKCPDWNTWNKNHRSDCRLVVKDKNKVIAWAALLNVSDRCVYEGVCEVSIYIGSNFKGCCSL